MTGFNGTTQRCSHRSGEPPVHLPLGRPATAGRTPAVSAAGPQPDAAPAPDLVDLGPVCTRPMPVGTVGAVVRTARGLPGGPLRVSWLPAAATNVGAGRVVLSWKPSAAGVHGGGRSEAEERRTRPAAPARMDVTATLHLAGGPVLLARWPSLGGDWTDVVRPTVTEVMGLHSALSLATLMLERCP